MDGDQGAIEVDDEDGDRTGFSAIDDSIMIEDDKANVDPRVDGQDADLHINGTTGIHMNGTEHLNIPNIVEMALDEREAEIKIGSTPAAEFAAGETPYESIAIRKVLNFMKFSKDMESEKGNISSHLEVDSELPVLDDKYADFLEYRTRFKYKPGAPVILDDEVRKTKVETRTEELEAARLENAKIKTSRVYQSRMFEAAKKDNIIAVLDTGMGKTFIACLLINHIFAEEVKRRETGQKVKWMFFCVHSIPLVFQQSNVLSANCRGRVGKYCGEMGTDFWSKEKWMEEFGKYDIIVLTAEVLYRCLVHSFITIDSISLLVFDECHHAKKQHVFARIMRNFYREKLKLDPFNVPKIFGMTASPIDGATKNIKGALDELEQTLHSKILTAINMDLVEEQIRKPKEWTFAYDAAGPLMGSAYTTEILRAASEFDMRDVFEKAINSTAELGQWCADKIAEFTAAEFVKQVYHKDIAKEKLQDMESSEINITPRHRKLVEKLRIILNKSRIEPLTEQRLSSKVKVLVRVLESVYKTHASSTIVFVSMRSTALALDMVLKHLQIPALNSELLIGHGNINVNREVQMGFKEQEAIIRQFRQQSKNLLVATSIAEEGLDIPRCNYIIRFDLFNTTIQYIQSRGRARAADSKFIFLFEKGNVEQSEKLKKISEYEQTVKNLCNSLDPDRKIEVPDYGVVAADPSILLKDDFGNPLLYTIEKTGAQLTPNSALSILHRYCSTLTDKDFRSQGFERYKTTERRVDKSQQYQATVYMPPNAAINEVSGNWQRSKAHARQAAAFFICRALHQCHGLNDFLMPSVHDPDENEGSIMNYQSAGKRRYQIHKPTIWQCAIKDVREWYCCILQINNENSQQQRTFRNIALFTSVPVPNSSKSRELKLEKGVHEASCKLLHIQETITLSPNLQNNLIAYTKTLLESVVPGTVRKCVGEISFALAPCVPGNPHDFESVMHYIAWNEVSDALLHQPQTPLDLNDGDIDDQSFIHEGQLFQVAQIRRDLNPLSQLASDGTSAYSWFHERHPKANPPLVDQPLLQAMRIITASEIFSSSITQKNPKFEYLSNKKLWLIPQFCFKYKHKLSVLNSASYLPYIFTQLDVLSNTFDFIKAAVGLPIRDLTLASEAFITQSAMLPINYERLEWLGDSIINFIAASVVFVLKPGKKVGEAERICTKAVCNRALYARARAMNVAPYIYSTPFLLKSWKPPGLYFAQTENAIENATDYHDLGDKTLSDVLEALVAVYFIEGGLQMGLYATASIVFGQDETAPIKQWSDFQRLYGINHLDPIEISEAALKDVQQIIQYTFKNPCLLGAALTHSSSAVELYMDYERLELLGDALLEAILCWLGFLRYPYEPGRLNSVKIPLASNSFLGMICVLLGLHKYMNCFISNMPGKIEEYVSDLNYQRETIPGYNFWRGLNPPKELADLVEAILGAVYVDSGFDITAAEAVFRRCILSFWHDEGAFQTLDFGVKF